MPKKSLQPYKRVLYGENKPSDHQRTFLYLPLETFRDYTNIRSIIQKYHGRTDKKPLKEIEIKQKIKKYHSELGNLNKWNDWHLDKLDFIWPEDGGERV